MTVLLNDLRARGYIGGYTILCDDVAGLRPAPPVEPVIRFEIGPGEQLQVDWAVFRRGGERLLALVAVLAVRERSGTPTPPFLTWPATGIYTQVRRVRLAWGAARGSAL